MLYFFTRKNELVLCEISQGLTGESVLTVTGSGGLIQREEFPTAETPARWLDVQARFQSAGWTGPAIVTTALDLFPPEEVRGAE
ncbi:MAG: hypothetical protein LC804_11965 [Acidobacteria bacterium]|nr:hypothetical protein [Acidobacteriota bacterium]